MKKIDDTVVIFKAFGDPTRFRIIKLITSSGNNLCVNALSKKLEISQPVISQHLKILKNAKIVSSKRMGYRIHYSVNQKTVLQLTNQINNLFKLLPGIGSKDSSPTANKD